MSAEAHRNLPNKNVNNIFSVSVFVVALLKERMYQLRNRYNLEKRKVETMRNDGVANPRSTWPLFNNLSFLDGHIRPRKSYKSMLRRSSTDRPSMPQLKRSYQNDHAVAMQQIMQIKYEEGSHQSDENDVVMYQSGYDS